MIDPTKLLRGAALALALLFATPFAGAELGFLGVSAAEAAVSKISISGNTTVDDATIVDILTVGIGDNPTKAQLNASADALLGSGLFSSASVSLSGSTLVVKVSENQIVGSVLFEGNYRFTDANLVAMVDLVNKGVITEAGLAQDVASIKNAYVGAGYSNVSVTTRLEPVGNGRTRVVFVVNEGVHAGVVAINFTGNNSVNAWTLKSILKTHETHWLSWLFQDDSYTQEQLDYDRELIRRYYADHGFPDAQVTSAVAEYNAERAGYFVTFTIIEGDRYQFGNIGVETSIAGLDANSLTSTIRTHEGYQFSALAMSQTAEDMAVEATNQGFPFADVRPRVDRDPSTGTFAVTYLVDEGERLYIDRINITGNDKTRDFVIRRELPFAEGDPFNRSLLAVGKSRIEALGFFSLVDVRVESAGTPDKVNININVTEQSTGDYGATLGWDSKQGVIGELSLEERNFLGRGQYAKVSLGASLTGRTFDFAFTEPHFAGLDLSAGIDIYARAQDETATSRFGTTSTGGQLRFGLPVTRDLQATLFTGLAQTVIDDNNPTDSALVTDLDVYNKVWIGYGLTYNGVDSQRHPTQGLYATLNQSYLFGDHSYNYLKTEAKARYFVPLMDTGIVASVKGQAGIINDFSGAGVSPLETFTYGSSLVRGYIPGQMGPRTAATQEYVGYTAYAGASAELTFPLPGVPESYGLSAALFGDAAVIAGAGANPGLDPASLGTVKTSIGASILWDSPFGPLRGDFAYVPNPGTDGTQFFGLTLNSLL
ncbi:MAG TPA: outer membrane protein assembly factor BamA [Devosia sp.]|nr:outer membrane protein assembly factor BamA [Devosia sp.]